MSRYRDERDAARQRIEALEDKVAERDGEIAKLKSALRARPRRGPFGGAGIGIAILAVLGLTVVIGGVLALVVIRRPAAAAPPPDPAPPPTLADPAPLPPPAAQSEAEPSPGSRGPSAAGPDEGAVRRSLEDKVWSGRGSLEDIRMLKAICSHQGDRVCRDRAAEILKKKQEQRP
jgi:hypothetical protein